MKTFNLIAQIEGSSDACIFEVTHTFQTHAEAVDAIRHTVMEWQTGTAEGWQAYLDSAEDFNWGDFSLYLESLRAYLPETIVDIRCNTENDSVFVNHDELLMEEPDEE